MERNRDGEGGAGGDADAALIAACAAFHAAFAREEGARRPSDEESDRLGDATDAAFRQAHGQILEVGKLIRGHLAAADEREIALDDPPEEAGKAQADHEYEHCDQHL